MKFIILIILLIPALSHADTPKVLINALDTYLEKGKNEFIPALLKGSPLEGDKSLVGVGNMMAQVEAYYGNPESWEIMADCELTDRIKITYFVIYFDRGPTYGYIHSYKKSNGKAIVTSFLVNTEAKEILPFIPIKKGEICGDHES